MNTDEIPPEIERQMHIKPIPPLPDKIEGTLTLEQIEKFSPAERIIIAGLNENNQLIRISHTAVMVHCDQTRKSEAAMLIKSDRTKAGLKWVAGVLFVAIISAAALKFIHQ